MGEQGGSLRRRLGVFLVVPLVLAVVGLAAGPTAVAAAKPTKQERVEAVIAAALEYLGVPYRLGGEGPAVMDCSGLVYRAFSDANQLKAVGGARMRAVGYLRWFERRGLTTGDETLAEPGDLIVYADGEHIGIYLGRGEVVSALTTSGITVHRLHGINWSFTHVLKVDWSMGRKPVFPAGDESAEGDTGDTAGGDEGDAQAAGEDGLLGLATGSLHLRVAPDPAAEIVGIVSRGSDFTVVGADYSPGGSLWLNVTTNTGATGWIWSQFTQLPEGADVSALSDPDTSDEEPEGESLGVATGSLNLRSEPDPNADIVGWVRIGSTFRILGGAHSPGGWLWLNVESESGATGWIWSQWTEYPAEALEASEAAAGDDVDTEEEEDGQADAAPSVVQTTGSDATDDGPVEAQQY